MEVKLFKGNMLLNGDDVQLMNYTYTGNSDIDNISQIITFKANLTRLIAPLIKMDETKNIDLIEESDRIVNDVVIPLMKTRLYNNMELVRNSIVDLVFIEIYRLGLRCSLYKSDDNKIVNYINNMKYSLPKICSQLI